MWKHNKQGKNDVFTGENATSKKLMSYLEANKTSNC